MHRPRKTNAKLFSESTPSGSPRLQAGPDPPRPKTAAKTPAFFQETTAGRKYRASGPLVGKSFALLGASEKFGSHSRESAPAFPTIFPPSELRGSSREPQAGFVPKNLGSRLGGNLEVKPPYLRGMLKNIADVSQSPHFCNAEPLASLPPPHCRGEAARFVTTGKGRTQPARAQRLRRRKPPPGGKRTETTGPPRASQIFCPGWNCSSGPGPRTFAFTEAR
jgi:hypothetical protein